MTRLRTYERTIGILLITIGLIALGPNSYREYTSGWVRGEFYFTLMTQVLFFIGLYYYIKRNTLSPYWQRKYLLNILIGTFLLFYLYGSASYDTSFPTLGALFMYSMVFFFTMSIIDLIMTLIISNHTKFKSL